MTYEELVNKLKTAYAKADASKIEEHVAVQFNVTGEGEGALYLEVSDGKIDIQPYEYYDRDAIVVTGANTLVDIAAGKVDVVEAYNTGVIKVEGNVGKAALLAKITAKKAPAKKAPAKKAPAKKAPAKKETAKKETVKKAAAPKAAAKKEEAPKKVAAPKAEAPKAEAPKAAETSKAAAPKKTVTKK